MREFARPVLQTPLRAPSYLEPRERAVWIELRPFLAAGADFRARRMFHATVDSLATAGEFLRVGRVAAAQVAIPDDAVTAALEAAASSGPDPGFHAAPADVPEKE